MTQKWKRLSVPRGLLMVCLWAGCTTTGEIEVSFDEVVLGDSGSPAPLESANALVQSTQVVYVNFGGPKISDCADHCSDAPGNRSWAIGKIFGTASVDFAPYTSTSGQAAIVATIKNAYADYDVEVTTNRPSSGDYTMVVISPTSGPHHGVAPLNCNNTNPNDIAFVYSIGASSVGFISRAAVHELGHSFGLSHVTSGADFMQWASSGSDFTVSTYDKAHESGKCFDGNTQDAPAMLANAIGYHPYDGLFADDDGNTHEANIDRIGEAKITVGCGKDGSRPLYCPSQKVTRAQMAVFLKRALSLPASSTNHFWDDDGTWYEAAANAMADASITFGCGGGKYCGDNLVTRGQMAAFLSRALGLPPAAGDHFSDDTGTFYESAANRIYEAGITHGCGGGKYCGNQSLPRDQMASFLARAFL